MVFEIDGQGSDLDQEVQALVRKVMPLRRVVAKFEGMESKARLILKRYGSKKEKENSGQGDGHEKK